MKFLKNIIPYIIILFFITGVLYYYGSNKTDFYFLRKININILGIVICLCLLYLFTEALIFKLIVSFYKKNIKFRDCFLVICTTYLCNTFIQFSGLGFRAYYLKKFQNIEVNKFIILSLFIILIELLIFSFLSLILIFVFYNLDSAIDVYNLIYNLLVIILIFSFIGIFFHKKIFLLIDKFKFIKKFKIINQFFDYFKNFNSSRLGELLKYFCLIFTLQFIILFLIFFISISILSIDNSILFSLIVTMSTDLSFIFTFTPYALGISETFIFFSSENFNVKLSEILYLTNIFRLSMFLIYSIFGILNLYIFSKKIL